MLMIHDLGVARRGVYIFTTQDRLRNMHSNAPVEAMKKQLLFGFKIDVSIYNIFSRIRHGCCGRVERRAQNAHVHHSIMPSISSAHISTCRKATQTLLNLEAVVSLPW